MYIIIKGRVAVLIKKQLDVFHENPQDKVKLTHGFEDKPEEI
jgi:hypothetical protein